MGARGTDLARFRPRKCSKRRVDWPAASNLFGRSSDSHSWRGLCSSAGVATVGGWSWRFGWCVCDNAGGSACCGIKDGPEGGRAGRQGGRQPEGQKGTTHGAREGQARRLAKPNSTKCSQTRRLQGPSHQGLSKVRFVRGARLFIVNEMRQRSLGRLHLRLDLRAWPWAAILPHAVALGRPVACA